MTEQEILEKAKKRVKAKKGFFLHFGVYLATVALLFTINYVTFHESHIWWAFIPSVAWGVAIVPHYISVFGIGIISKFIASFGFDVNWEEDQLEKEIKKIKRQNLVESKEENFVDLDDELELKEIEKLGNELDDKDFV